VIPVIIRDVTWQEAKFAALQVLPKEGKAVTLWPDRDMAWRNISECNGYVGFNERRKNLATSTMIEAPMDE
jgi:hypothetical protein